MTREELEAEVRFVDRKCRGVLPTEARKKVAAALRAEDLELAVQIDRDERVLHSNVPCSYDFNEIILANPLDGEEHEYTCPNCGVKGTYVAPRYEVDAS